MIKVLIQNSLIKDLNHSDFEVSFQDQTKDKIKSSNKTETYQIYKNKISFGFSHTDTLLLSPPTTSQELNIDSQVNLPLNQSLGILSIEKNQLFFLPNTNLPKSCNIKVSKDGNKTSYQRIKNSKVQLNKEDEIYLNNKSLIKVINWSAVNPLYMNKEEQKELRKKVITAHPKLETIISKFEEYLETL